MATIPDARDASREIAMARIFEAPRDLVFRMWTQPEHIAWWWGPTGFSTTIEEMDVRPGGTWRFVMHGPDGTDYPNHIIYRAIEAPEHLSYTHASAPRFDADVTFRAQGERTLVEMRMRFESAELRERVAREFGAVEGLSQTLGRLASMLAPQTALGIGEPVIRIERVFDAPRERVFGAHVDPGALTQWWGPHGHAVLSCSVDPRPGGSWRVEERARDGRTHVFSGNYLEVVEPERIVTTFMWGGKPDEVLEVTTTFEDLGSATRLTSVTRLPSVAARDEMLRHGAIGGALQGYERLQALLVGARPNSPR